MGYEGNGNNNGNRDNRYNDQPEIFSRPVKAGKRTYFFDVKATKGNDYYLTITESKKRVGDDGKFQYEKHKLFLYKEDFEKFADGLNEVINFISENNPGGPPIHHNHSSEENAAIDTAADTSTSAGNNTIENDISFEDLGNK